MVNATTKSGSNHIHGVVYEFLRNQLFDARNYFDQTLPAYHQNQFGATIGLPIIHDKLFLFMDYEGLRQSRGRRLQLWCPPHNNVQEIFRASLTLPRPQG